MKKLLSILLAAAMLLSMAACGGRTKDDPPKEELSSVGSSSMDEEAPPEEATKEEQAKPFGVGYYKGLGINPYTCTNAQNQTITGLVYEPLFELDRNFVAAPCLAEDISVKVKKKTVTEELPVKTTKTTSTAANNGGDAAASSSQGETSQEEEVKTKTVTRYTTNVTLTIRKGVTFSDGTKLGAEDVVYSMERAMAKGSIYRSRLAHFSNVSSGGGNTVTFTVNMGQADVAALLTFPIVKEGTGEEKFPVGTGPYTPYLKKNNFKKLKSNPNWWRQEMAEEAAGEGGAQKPAQTNAAERLVEEIRVYTYENSDDLIFGFTSSQVTALNIDFTASDALIFPGAYSVTDYPTTNFIYLGCNTKKGTLCSTRKVRAALYRSIDRDSLALRMLAGHAEGSVLPVSPKSPWYDEELAESLAYDIDTAKKLCSKLNMSATLQLIVNSDSTFKSAMAGEIKKQLTNAGYHVKVEKLNWKDFKAALKAGNYDLYLGEVKLDASFDLSRLVCSGGNLNYSGYSDSALTTALQEYHATVDRTKKVDGEKVSTKAEAAKEYFTVLSQKAPIIPLCFKNSSVLTIDQNVTAPLSTQQNLYAQLWSWKLAPGVAEVSK